MKIATVGVSATVLALFSFYLYSKYVKVKRTNSTSSEEADDEVIMKALSK